MTLTSVQNLKYLAYVTFKRETHRVEAIRRDLAECFLANFVMGRITLYSVCQQDIEVCILDQLSESAFHVFAGTVHMSDGLQ